MIAAVSDVDIAWNKKIDTKNKVQKSSAPTIICVSPDDKVTDTNIYDLRRSDVISWI